MSGAQYTLGLAELLAVLLPEDIEEGSISTLPLGWREGWDDAAQASALTALADLAGELEALHARTGKRIRVALEPEPGCTIETIAQACRRAGRARARSGSASAWTPAISRCSSSRRRMRSRRCARPGCRS